MKHQLLVSKSCLNLAMVLFSVWTLSGSLRGEVTSAWETQEVNGEEYISLDQVQKFYGFTRSNRVESDVSLENPKVSMKLKIGSTDCSLNKTKVVFAKPVVEIDGVACISRPDLSELLDPILRPNFIKGSRDFETVILDPADDAMHPDDVDGSTTGAGPALKIAELTKEILEGKGYKVIMSREGEGSPSLQKRVEIANSVREDAIFIGVSFNSGPKANAGIQTIAIPTSPEIEAGVDPSLDGFAASSVALSTAVHGSLVFKLGKNTSDEGISRERLEVLSDVRHPAILIKAGNLSNPYEARLIENHAYQKAIASGIADGIGKYRNAVSGQSDQE